MTDMQKHFTENYNEIKENIRCAAEKSGRNAADIIMLAAVKTVEPDLINFAIENGVNYIGQNRVQELLAKDDLIAPAHRHFIGHLQTNKVKDIINRVEMIESVDSVRLAREISKQALLHGKTMNVLLEVNIGEEESKSGFETQEIEAAAAEIAKLPGISVKGLMAIPPICEKSEQSRKYFALMYKLFIDIGAKKLDNVSMDYLSMGMSNDYHIAIEEGANIVRIGTSLFGQRNYK